MKNVFGLAAAFAAGALAMYYMDPAAGRRRRALARDRGIAAGHDAEDFARGKSRHARDQLRGMFARTRSRLSREPVGDARLQQRIRARLGRLVERPGEVHVDVHEGRVVLRGTASTAEIDDLLDAIEAMRGVQVLDNRLSPAEDGGAASRH